MGSVDHKLPPLVGCVEMLGGNRKILSLEVQAPPFPPIQCCLGGGDQRDRDHSILVPILLYVQRGSKRDHLRFYSQRAPFGLTGVPMARNLSIESAIEVKGGDPF